jgi:hypothetical protein
MALQTTSGVELEFRHHPFLLLPKIPNRMAIPRSSFLPVLPQNLPANSTGKTKLCLYIFLFDYSFVFFQRIKVKEGQLAGGT